MNLTAISKFFSRSLAITIVLGLGILSLVSLLALGPVSSGEYQSYLASLENNSNPNSRVAGVSTFASLDYKFLLREKDVIYNIDQQSNNANINLKFPTKMIQEDSLELLELENNNLQTRIYTLELRNLPLEFDLVDAGGNILLESEELSVKKYSLILQPQEVVTVKLKIDNSESEGNLSDIYIQKYGNQLSLELGLKLENKFTE